MRRIRNVVDGYYRRTTSDRGLADKFQKYYLQGVEADRRTVILDHGCGRGRLLGLLSQLGVQMCAQDLARHQWWDRFEDCTFQVVSPEYHHLPWSSEQFDIVFDFEVIECLSPEDLVRLASEVYRVLKRDGWWIIRTLNPTGRDAHASQAPFAHRVEVTEDIGRRAGFTVVSRRFDGMGSRLFPRLIAGLRAIRSGDSFDHFSYDSAGLSPESDRSKYTTTFRKVLVP